MRMVLYGRLKRKKQDFFKAAESVPNKVTGQISTIIWSDN